MKESSIDMKDSNNNNNKINWRRDKVQEFSIKGFSQAEIARMLQISEATISRDIDYLKQIAQETIKNHIQKKLPYEYTKCISGLEEIIKEGWIIATHADKIGNTKDKLQSLALIKDTYNTKMDLLTNASLLQDSIRFVEQNKDKLAADSSDSLDKKLDYDGIPSPSQKDKQNGLERSTEINSNSEEQSTVF